MLVAAEGATTASCEDFGVAAAIEMSDSREEEALTTKELVFSVSPPKHRDAGFHPKPVE
jgi:hypothetical protein